MSQAGDAREARAHPIAYREFASFPEPPLAGQWRVLDRLESAMARRAGQAPAPPLDTGFHAFLRETGVGRGDFGSERAAGHVEPASVRAAQPPARQSLFRRYAATAGVELRLSDLFRRRALQGG